MRRADRQYRLGYLCALATATGILGVLAGTLLIRLISLFTNVLYYHRFSWQYVEAHQAPHLLANFFVPVAGAVVVGAMIKYGTDRLRGHGIPEAMEAVLYNGSCVSPRIALLRPLAAAIAIGSGGPFGAEGPIIQTGGALGSLLGQALKMSERERKVLLASTAAAGMTGIFATPLAAVLLAIELLLFEFSARTFIPVAISAGVAQVVRTYAFDPGPLFPEVFTQPLRPAMLPWLAGFGVVAGLFAAFLTRAIYAIEDWFEAIPGLDNMTRPVLGAALFAGLALLDPRILGVGYDNISDVLANHMTAPVLFSLFLFKLVGWLIALGSGTSGGVLAPLLTVGGALGACLAVALGHRLPMPPGMAALVMMGAVFGATVRAPLTAILFAAELTGHYDALVPVAVATTVADALARELVPYSFMTGKLHRRGRIPPEEYTGAGDSPSWLPPASSPPTPAA